VRGLLDVLPAGFWLESVTSADGGRRSGHRDLGGSAALGLVIGTEDDARLAFTGDVPPPPRKGTRKRRRWRRRWREALEADVLIAHLSTVPLTEMRKLSGLSAVDEGPRPDQIRNLHEWSKRLRSTTEQAAREVRRVTPLVRALVKVDRALRPLRAKRLRGATNPEVAAAGARLVRAADALLDTLAHERGVKAAVASSIDELAREAGKLGEAAAKLPTDSTELTEARRSLEAANPTLRGRLEFAYWLRPQDDDEAPADLLDQVGDWSPPRWHPYLAGFLGWARAYRTARGKPRAGLFVVGELSEELGTARSKIATTINESLFKSRKPSGAPRKKPRTKIHALTADVGLRLVVTDAPSARDRVRVQCSTCSLDNDRVRAERFHRPRAIREVCVKGENEGVFYNCDQHDPSQQPYPSFLEQLERFDIFGR
jgi:hypothetical protein